MRRFLIIVVVIAIFLAVLHDWSKRRQSNAPEAFTPATATKITSSDVQLLEEMDKEYTRLVDAVVPSVVSITTTKRVQTGYLIDPYEYLLHHRLQGVPQEEERTALGSGVIVSKEGHILTNNHVVEDTDKIQVQLSDGRMLPAEIVGTDAETDIAVLKIAPENIKALPIGNSDDVKVGQMVFAIGNPLGLQESVTRGIISAKSRVVDDSSLEYFQTDAAINQGNSGGPLVNLYGEIIGINTRIASQSGGSQGLGFAIPSNVARHALDEILKNGRVLHSYLGVVIRPLPPAVAAQAGVKEQGGAQVTQVLPGSPAEKAGLTAGDIIASMNGRDVASIRDLHNRVAEIPSGTKIELDVIHADGSKAKLTAEITEQPADFQALQSAPQTPGIAPAPAPVPFQPQATPVPVMENLLSGVSVMEIPQDHRADLPDNVKGVMVADIDPDSAAAQSPESLQQGDVIEEIDQKPVASVAEFKKTAAGLSPDAKQVLLVICRGKTRSYIVITPR